MADKKRVGVISLGCDKNRVDTEKMLAVLSKRHTITNDPENAEILIVNTCAFIESARKESIEEILACGELKKNGNPEKLIVTGCLPQKFLSEIQDAIPEVDAFLGVSDYASINEILDRLYCEERAICVGQPRGECGRERVLTTSSYAYLKIADGCSNYCTYCLIPKIRGKYRSVDSDELLKEAAALGELDELILVAQDVTAYGKDLAEKTTLTELIRKLSVLGNIHGIRLLYCYPENITEELINEFKSNAKMIRYIDIPLQHADDRILKLMNRKGTGDGYLQLIDRLKNEIPGLAVRSTFIAGFPGETEEAFGVLVEFLKKAQIFNAGFFAYSKEDDTAAAKLPDQLPASVKNARLKKLYSVQKKISLVNNKRLVGKSFSVISEGFDGDRLVYRGRAYFNAPDADGKIYFFSDEEVKAGERVNVKITKAESYDLYGVKI